jgi:hypothetical protein
MGPSRRDPVLDVVARALAPYVGENMARAAVDGQCAKLGLTGALDDAQVDALLAVLAPALGVFVGRDKALGVLAEVRRAVAASRRSAPPRPPDATGRPPTGGRKPA